MIRFTTAAALAAASLAAHGQGAAPGIDVSLVLQGRYTHAKDIAERHITGFVAGGHEENGHAHGGGGRGFSLGHSELVLSGSIDPYFRGYANFAVAGEAIEVEEAWFQTLALGRGFTVKGGRYLSGVGYTNELHPHAWDFADQNLMYRALFGTHLIQDGVQARWLAPTATFFELGAELARGQFFPGSEAGGDRNGAGAWAAFARVGGDVGASNSWRAGLSYLDAQPREREGHFEDVNDVEAHTAFSGDSKSVDRRLHLEMGARRAWRCSCTTRTGPTSRTGSGCAS